MTIIKRRHAREQKEMKENEPDKTYLWRAVRHGQFCQVICRQQKWVVRLLSLNVSIFKEQTTKHACGKSEKEEKTREMHYVRTNDASGI